MSAAAIPLAMSAMQQIQSQQAARSAAAQAEARADQSARSARAQAGQVRSQAERQQSDARRAFERQQALRRVQGAVSGAGTSTEVLAGAAAENEQDLLDLDRQADQAVADIMTGAGATYANYRARAADSRRKAGRQAATTIMGLGSNIGPSGGILDL